MDVLRQMSLITEVQQDHYYSECIWPQMELDEPNTILFGFFYKNRHIGYGGLVHISWHHRRAEISFLLDSSRMEDQKLYAADFTSFLTMLKEAAFDDLGLDRFFTETYATRKHHISVLEASGLRREGVMRRHVIIDGQPTDSLIHGYLRVDYET